MAYTGDRRKQFPKLSVMKKDSELKPVLSKLIHDTSGYGHTHSTVNRRNQPPAEGLIRIVSDEITQNVTDYSNIMQLLPDTELAAQILISSILSPKDMVNVELGYRVNEHYEENEIAGHLLEIVKRHFQEHYKIKPLLPKMLEEILFSKGSYPCLVLPESTIDNVINSDGAVGLESLRQSNEVGDDYKPVPFIGILGRPTKGSGANWSLESHRVMMPSAIDSEIVVGDFRSKVHVTDNFNVLKFPKLSETVRSGKLKDLIGMRSFSLESYRNKTRTADETPLEEVMQQFYQRKNFTFSPFFSLKRKHGYISSGTGHPLIMKLPSESVIPVHVPSNPEEHIGYFVLLDQFGNPLNRVKENDYYKDLNRNIRTNKITSQLLEAGKRAITGFDRNDIAMSEAEVVRLYSEVIESDLLNRLRNGLYGDNVEIGKPLEVYRIMLTRALANRGTQLLYVPCEIMSYMAFDFNAFGVGKSLLEDNKILASIRAMLLFSNTMASIKNSTGKTALKIQLDPQDPDPSSTVEYLLHEYSKNRQSGYPLGASNPLDIINFLQKAGIDIQVSGNAAYPETVVDVEHYNTNKTEVDTTLEEEIKKKYFMSLGLSPETIDQTSQIEFATSIVSSNLLLAKRVILYQDKLLGCVKDFMEKYLRNSALLWEELMECVKTNKKVISKENKKLPHEKIVDDFITALELHLPRPDSAKLENQMQSFEVYRNALESAVDAYFGQDSFVLKEFDDVEENIATIRAAVIAHFQREWLRNNNVLPELMDLVLVDDKGKAVLDLLSLHGNHLELIGKSIVDLLKKLQKDREARDKALGVEEEEEEGTDTFGGDDTEEEGFAETEDTEEEEDLAEEEPEAEPEEETEQETEEPVEEDEEEEPKGE